MPAHDKPKKITQRQKDAFDQTLVHLDRFAEDIFGLKLYKWQRDVLGDLDKPGSRVALKAANGSGKTAMCAAPAALWHALMFPNSVCVTTSGVYRQVKEQMWPTIRSLSRKVEGFGIEINQTDLRIPQLNSRVIGFSTDDPGRFEGFHADNLMVIIDESKSVKDSIFEAVERCQPNRMLVMSSPGGNSGEFYRIFTRHSDIYKTHTVTSFDCPHIEKSWIDQQIKRWGEDHPLVRSMIFGEFMATSDESLLVTYDAYQKCLTNPPRHEKTAPIAGVDFAAGSDENVLAVREGNKLTRIVSWVDKDTMAAVGKFIVEFRRAGLKPEDIYCDEGGLGRPMADALREAGWDINRVNFGGRARDSDAFVNRSAEMWYETARLIEKQELILIDDEVLMAQLTSRRCRANKAGKMELETKGEMKSRGLSSPDRADAVCMAVAMGSDHDYMDTYVRPSIEEMFEGVEIPDGYESTTHGIHCG